MAADDGRSPTAADAITTLQDALRRKGFQRRIPSRVRQNSQRAIARRSHSILMQFPDAPAVIAKLGQLRDEQRCIGGKPLERIPGGWRDLPHDPCLRRLGQGSQSPGVVSELCGHTHRPYDPASILGVAMKQWLRVAMCAAVILPVGAMATDELTPVTEASTEGAAARAMARVQLSVFVRGAGVINGGSDTKQRCIRNLSTDKIIPTYQKLIAKEIPAADIPVLDAFFASSAGQKYAQAVIDDGTLDAMSQNEFRYMKDEVGEERIRQFLDTLSPRNGRIEPVLRPAWFGVLQPCLG